MGKDSKPKDAGGKGKGKQAAGGADENSSKGKGKGGKASDGLGTCTYVKGLLFWLPSLSSFAFWHILLVTFSFFSFFNLGP